MRILILTILLMSGLWSQVLDMNDMDRLHLKWELQSSDSITIDYTTVYKSVDGGNFVQYGTVPCINQDTVQVFLDSLLVPGILYAYYLTATDSFGLTSGPSDTVSEALPVTYPMPGFSVYAGEAFPLIGLTPYVYDVNGDELRWIALEPDNDSIQVSITGNNAYVTYTEGFIGSYSLTFLVEQTDSLRDFFNFTSAVFTINERPKPKVKIIWIESTRH